MQLDKCPHCNASHVITTREYENRLTPVGPYELWTIERCQNPKCQKIILTKLDGNGNILGLYPAGNYELDPNLNISQEIRDDYSEAGLCLSAGCPKASVVMSRRVLQRILKEQGCSEHNLTDQIDKAIKSDILRKPMHKIATEIRQYGNLGAHPDDKQLADIDKEKAKQILDFARLIIEEFYEIPATAEKLQKDRQPPPASQATP